MQKPSLSRTIDQDRLVDKDYIPKSQKREKK